MSQPDDVLDEIFINYFQRIVRESIEKHGEASKEHNDNLLNTAFNQVGHAVCKDKTNYKIVQFLKG